MVLAAHVVFTCYGFWLPNDPRGSWSDFVRSWELLRFGPATKTTDRRSLAHDAHDQARRRSAKRALRYDPVKFTGVQAWHVGRGIARRSLSRGTASLHVRSFPTTSTAWSSVMPTRSSASSGISRPAR